MSRLAGALAHVEALNLAYSYQGSPGDILARIGSTDRSGTYVFPVRAEPVGRSGSKTSVYWQVFSGFESMYTLWNPGLTDVEVLVTLRYDNGTGLYEMPVHLVPHESAMIDVGELVRQGIPDFQGRLLPLSPIEGSLLVSGPQNGPEDMIDVVLAEGIYNPRKATCGGGCVTCNGWTSPCFDPVTGFLVPPAGNQQGQLCYNYYNGWVYWITSSANWFSGNTSVATVQTHGQGSPGLTTGVGPGSTYISAQSISWIPVNAGQICSSEPIACPSSQVGGGGTVTVPSIQITSADITQGTAGNIGISLQPAGLSGSLSIAVQSGTGGGNQYYVLTQAGRSSGTYTESFNRTNIPVNEYTIIQAEWTVSGAPASVVTQYSYHFKALGVFLNTRYNTPTEQFCTGNPQNFTYSSGGCINANCSAQNGSGRQQFLAEVLENGSGLSQSIGYMSREWNCPTTYRAVPQPSPQCGGSLAVGQSVARNQGNPDLPCQAMVFVDGVGTVTVQDTGGGLAMNQLDHYAGTTGCNRTAGTIGNRSVFRLF